MKKLLFLLWIIILIVACNKPVCPAYSDSANNLQSTFHQSGSYRADGIHRVYRDAPPKR
jgi:hypothetical protein